MFASVFANVAASIALPMALFGNHARVFQFYN